ACQRPSAPKVVFKVNLAKGATVTTATLGPGGGAKVSAPCLEKVVQDVFLKAPPRVGTEAAVVLDLASGLRLDGDVALLGTLASDAVEAGIRARMGGIAQCYVDGLAEAPGLAGELLVAFTVLPDGRPVAPEVRRTALWNPEVEACVLREVAQARFPAPEGGAIVRVSYPFTFDPPE
ncbi:MAG: AgmX/PglI C-terminal domain-containing protein, partial [Myxococcota bacterium]